MPKQNLTVAQLRVMKWLGYGWRSDPHEGGSVIVNGKTVCSTSTIEALYRKGFVLKDEDRCWLATEDGRSIAARLCL